MYKELSFPTEEWDPSLRASANDIPKWMSTGWQINVKLPPPRPIYEGAELQDVIAATTLRSAARDEEISQQDGGFNDVFWGVLGVDPDCANRIDQFREHLPFGFCQPAVMKLKLDFLRARPYHYILDKCILNPLFHKRWPAYPSGHATVAYLFAYILSECFPEKQGELFATANRIAANREVAGVHFRSDSLAGAELARQMYMNLLLASSEYKSAAATACTKLKKCFT